MRQKVETMPFADWPLADRLAWERECVPSRRLRPGGAAAHLSDATQAGLVRCYGGLLACCERSGTLDREAEAAAHVTPQALEMFAAELRGSLGSVTCTTYVYRIRRMANILAPHNDLAWLGDIEAELRYLERPRPKHHRIVPSERLWTLGREMIGRGEGANHLTKLTSARLVRDGLMIAILAICPIRLRNFAELEIGRSVRRIGDNWWIILLPAETKTGQPDERPLPKALTAAIDRWVYHWRSFFLNPGNAFWPSVKGGRLAYTYVGNVVTETTRRELGVPVNPHLFRDCGVHTVATRAGNRMGVAVALLQHRDERTTEIYNKSASHVAVRRYHQILEALLQSESATRRSDTRPMRSTTL